MKTVSTTTGIIIIATAAVIAFGGIFWYLQTGNPINYEPNRITNTKNNIETADWKTYRNDEYGFEFKYPNGTENFTKDDRCHANFCLGINSSPYTFSISGPFDGSVDQEINYKYYAESETVKEIKINGHRAAVREEYLPYYYNIVAMIQGINDKELWSIGTQSISKFPNETKEHYTEEVNNVNSFFREILSTFKFTH